MDFVTLLSMFIGWIFVTVFLIAQDDFKEIVKYGFIEIILLLLFIVYLLISSPG